LIDGCARIAGLVHILGNLLTSADAALDLTGDGLILNQYSGIRSTLDGRLSQNAAVIDLLPHQLFSICDNCDKWRRNEAEGANPAIGQSADWLSGRSVISPRQSLQRGIDKDR